MNEEVKPRRRYNTTRRQAQAQETRRLIVEAAQRLFVARGYGGTTMDAIAAEAGVAVDTVYAVYGTKRALLARALDAAIVGDLEPVPLLQRPFVEDTVRERDQREQIRMFAAGMGVILERVGPLFLVLWSAARIEPEIETLRRDLLQQRLAGMRHFVQSVRGNGPLRPGLTAPAAAEQVWTLSSPEVHHLLTADRGWSRRRYQKWLADSLCRLLLP